MHRSPARTRWGALFPSHTCTLNAVGCLSLSLVYVSLEEGEGITVTAEEGSGEDSRNEEADAMAEQECFFGADAMPDKPVCRVCGETTVPGARITPMAW
jgi:hypothetical protein